MRKLTGIYIYPIKGLGGISLSKSFVTKRGLQFDRRWQIVDTAGNFFTQRGQREMALLQVLDHGDSFLVKHKNRDIVPLIFPKEQKDFSSKMMVTIWKDTCEACIVGKEASDWFSKVLDTECHLVFMPESTHRQVNLQFGKPGDAVSFADGYPISIVGEASLEDLNGKLEDPLPMNRFRPNITYSGGKPFEEDDWQLIQIGQTVVFRGGKPSQRCTVITINQETSEAGKEPLKTLNTYRKRNDGVFFGMNIIWDKEESENGDTVISIGKEVTVLKKEPFNFAALV